MLRRRPLRYSFPKWGRLLANAAVLSHPRVAPHKLMGSLSWTCVQLLFWSVMDSLFGMNRHVLHTPRKNLSHNKPVRTSIIALVTGHKPALADLWDLTHVDSEFTCMVSRPIAELRSFLNDSYLQTHTIFNLVVNI